MRNNSTKVKKNSENEVNSFNKNSENEVNSFGKGSEKFDQVVRRGDKVEKYQQLQSVTYLLRSSTKTIL